MILKIFDIQNCTLNKFEKSKNEFSKPHQSLKIFLVKESVENVLKLVLKGYQKEGLDIDYL